MKPLKLLLIGLLVLNPANAFGFKIGTHIWVAQQVLNDVVPDGKITIEGREYVVDSALVAALRKHQNEYRMGLVGPDGFPDLVAPQVTAHPGVSGAWQTDDWLRWMLTNARTDEERAFAAEFIAQYGLPQFCLVLFNTNEFLYID